MNYEKFDIFVSYAHEDKKIVEEVIGKLSSAGLSVWIDKEIHHGESISSRIVKAIERSSFVLFFSSKNSNVSDYCIGEILVAVQKKKCIIPIKIDSSDYCDDLLVHLIRLHYVNFIKGFSAEEYDELVKVLSGSIQITIQDKENEILKNNDEILFYKKAFLVTIISLGIILCVLCFCMVKLNLRNSNENQNNDAIPQNIAEYKPNSKDKQNNLELSYTTKDNAMINISIELPLKEIPYFRKDCEKNGIIVVFNEYGDVAVAHCSGTEDSINQIVSIINNRDGFKML